MKNGKKIGFFAMLLSLLGIGGCDILENGGDDGGMRLMYGTPTADWSIKGKVTDEDNNPIGGIQVILGSRQENTSSVIYDVNYFPIDTLITGSDGTYSMSNDRNGRNHYPVKTLQVDVKDIDGPDNGGEFNDSQIVIRDIRYEGGSVWYKGRAEIQVPDFVLKKKK